MVLYTTYKHICGLTHWLSGKESSCNAIEEGSIPGSGRSPTHSSILAWRIPWAEEPGKLQSIGSQRVGHDWSKLAHTHTNIYIIKKNTHQILYILFPAFSISNYTFFFFPARGFYPQVHPMIQHSYWNSSHFIVNPEKKKEWDRENIKTS